jgi:hypothetical protein
MMIEKARESTHRNRRFSLAFRVAAIDARCFTFETQKPQQSRAWSSQAPSHVSDHPLSLFPPPPRNQTLSLGATLTNFITNFMPCDARAVTLLVVLPQLHSHRQRPCSSCICNSSRHSRWSFHLPFCVLCSAAAGMTLAVDRAAVRKAPDVCSRCQPVSFAFDEDAG